MLLFAYANCKKTNAQSRSGCNSTDEKILLDLKPTWSTQNNALKLIRGKTDTIMTKVDKDYEYDHATNAYYYHISTFPPKVRVAYKMNKAWLVYNPNTEPSWAWRESRIVYKEKITTDKGLIGWWCFSFSLAFAFGGMAWIGKSNSVKKMLWSLGITSILTGIAATCANSSFTTEGFVWLKFFSLIASSALGVLFYILIFKITIWIENTYNKITWLISFAKN